MGVGGGDILISSIFLYHIFLNRDYTVPSSPGGAPDSRMAVVGQIAPGVLRQARAETTTRRIGALQVGLK